MMWQKQITELIHEIEKELVAIEAEIAEKKKLRDTVYQEYTDAQIKLAEASQVFDSFQKETLAIKRELEDRETAVLVEERRVDTLIYEADIKVEEAKKKLANLERDIAIKTAELTAIDIKKSQIKELEQEVSRLTNLTELKVSEIKVLEKKLEQLEKDIEVQNEKFKADNASKVKSIEEALAFIRSEENRLSEKEKALNTKEQDLIIVENRYRKMYDEKGASFKI